MSSKRRTRTWTCLLACRTLVREGGAGQGLAGAHACTAAICQIGGVHVRPAPATGVQATMFRYMPPTPRLLCVLTPLPLLLTPLALSGYDVDLETAAAVPELDLIVGGHSHTFLANPGQAPITDPTVPGVTPENCASLQACDVPVGPYPTWVDSVTAAGSPKRVPVVQAFFASK